MSADMSEATPQPKSPFAKELVARVISSQRIIHSQRLSNDALTISSLSLRNPNVKIALITRDFLCIVVTGSAALYKEYRDGAEANVAAFFIDPKASS